MDVEKTKVINFEKWADSTRQIYDSLSRVLDKDFSFQTTAANASPNSRVTNLNQGQESTEFSRRSDVEALLEVLKDEPSAYIRAPMKVFTALSDFFEMGFYFSLAPSTALANGIGRNSWNLKHAFVMGRFFLAPQTGGRDFQLMMPDLHLEQVLRMDGQKFLNRVSLGKVSGLEESSAFAFRVTNQDLFVLVCDRPNVWQMKVVEEVFVVLNRLFGRV